MMAFGVVGIVSSLIIVRPRLRGIGALAFLREGQAIA